MQAPRGALQLAMQTLGRLPKTRGLFELEQTVGLVRYSCLGRRLGHVTASSPAVASIARQPPSAAWSTNIRALLKSYKQLSKLKLSALVVATTAAGFVTGSNESIDWNKLAWTAAGTMGASACANTLNQWWEVPRDALMNRTRNRPLPRGLVTSRHALAFAAVTGTAGLGCLLWQANTMTAALGAANIGLYACVYTPLKAVSVYNTWVGAVVGAIPPLMGWAAARGSLDAGSIPLASACYFWQLPHFLSLSWYAQADYARGGYAMLSLADATGRRTAACCLRNSLYLMPAGLLAWHLGIANAYFATEAGIMAGVMAITAARFYRNPSFSTARSVFRASLLYLPVFMVGLMVHRTPEARQHVTHTQQATQSSDRHWNRGSEDTISEQELKRDESLRLRTPDCCANQSAAMPQSGPRSAVFVAPFPLLPLPPQERQSHHSGSC